MAEFYIQYRGKLVPYNDEEWISTNKLYKYGSLNKEPFESETIPVCNLCGSELKFQRTGDKLLILDCLNPDCEVHKNSYGDVKLRAFLPKYYYDNIRKKRSENSKSIYDINYLMNEKNMSEDEAKEYIAIHKKMISDKNTGKNKEYYIKKYGEEYADKRKESSVLNINYWLSKGYTEEEAKELISTEQKRRASYVDHSKIKPLKKGDRDDLFFKERSMLCIEYWLKRGYTEEEAINNIKKTQIERSNKLPVEVRCEQARLHSKRCVEYWMNLGYSEEESKKMVSESQKTFTLEKCIEKYGETEGQRIYNERQKRWQESLHKNGNMTVGYSSVSQELFNNIIKHFSEEYAENIYYASKNKEYSIRYNEKTYLFDFCDLNSHKVIEFNGDLFHANPAKYKADDKPHPFEDFTAKELWDRDATKIKGANENGFEVLTIWHSDYKKDADSCLNKCLKFLRNEI